MKKTKEDKRKIVETLKEKIAGAKAIVLSDYHGLSVPQMQELKNSLKEVNAEFTVAKNTLVKLGAKKAKQEIDKESLTGPTAILFANQEPIETIKKFANFIKQYKLPKIKSGVLEGELLTKEQVLELAKIPSRQELYAKLVGSMDAPISNIVGVLNANLRNLVFVLSEIQKNSSLNGEAKGGAS